MSILRMSEEEYAKRQGRAKKPATRVDVPPVSPNHTKYLSRAVGGYASAKESRRAQELKLMLLGGKIRNLREQVPYELIPRQNDASGKMIERPCLYVCDFQYEELVGNQWRLVCEDVKGYRNTGEGPYRAFVVKRKLMLQKYGIRIRET